MSRLCKDNENGIPVGSICRNGKERLGVYTHYQGTGWRRWYGIGFDGKPWISFVKPVVAAANVNEYIQSQRSSKSCNPL